MTPDTPQDIRQASASALAEALRASRADTLATFAAYQRALPDRMMSVPAREELNPPLWELGHIGWFQEWWIARNKQRHRELTADPEVARAAPLRDGADGLYHSSRVAHATRWGLRLPDARATQDDLARQLERTLILLRQADETDTGLYFHRLALLHEDMHHEAAVYMAQTLGIEIDDARWQPATCNVPLQDLAFDAATHRLGREADPGFVFDNELGAHEVAIDAFRIDNRARTWAELLPFIDSPDYAADACWSEAGRAWRAAQPSGLPRHLRRDEHEGWQQQRFGRWLPLDPAQPAMHLSCHEAEAWCVWAGRRLPTEAEWEHAARMQPEAFHWGQVWEWTASAFEPYPGFVAHPYRDYSQPWFGGSRRVLRGASFATQPRMRDARYRNYFPPTRNDIVAGLRSCAV
jgi:gamma-glutamyl hercynylcysteine S-oxide synthase